MIIDVESFTEDFIEYLRNYYKNKSIYDRGEIKEALLSFMSEIEEIN